ncbi:MAG: HAD-IB family phosphatase [Holosporaceae bacterium]|jgi:HAD superfamily phosphoserine phosphatase-like hydrolase|nr:HAD-IB family phosphatase [Holosporaceae bacterium]
MTRFVFDLDGTVTSEETLPLIAMHFGVTAQIASLTEETMYGNMPFIESFIRRVNILGKLPIDQISDLFSTVPVYSKVVEFIREHRDNCVVATGNLGFWIDKLMEKVGCLYYCSDGQVRDNGVEKLTYILKKENIVDMYKNNGEKVVFIGDGNNDFEAMRRADISIASGLTHKPAKSVLSAANYLIFSEEALCRLLNQLL